VFLVVAICAVSDAFLIVLGVAGLGALIAGLPWLLEIIRWFGVLYLTWFGIKSLRSAFKVQALDASGAQSGSAKTVVLSVLGFTFLNPHVYLDTVILLGSIGNQFGPDKWWFTRGGYFTPDEFATMCSADYDGHNGALGVTKGMKVADPQVKMVMGGLASLNLEYVRCMKLWSDFNRQNGFPSDVLNFHHYSENGTHGISPEADNLKLKLKTIVEYRNTFLPGKEIWLSEFGYDVSIICSTHYIPADKVGLSKERS
jgi:arginine exporter protein ArgO